MDFQLKTVVRVPRLLLLSSALLVSEVHSEDLTKLSLDQLLGIEVVTASKFAQKASEAPSSVSVVTADDIQTFGYRTIADVLRSVRGLYVSYDRNYSYLGTRGSGRPGDYNSRVLVLVDGQRLNDNVYGQGSIGNEFPIDLDLVDRIEYVPGPGSALYGSNAFFGVLNIITKKVKASDGNVVSFEAASAGTTIGRLGSAVRFANGGNLLLHVSGLSSRGRDQYFPEYGGLGSSNGVAEGLDYERLRRVFAKYTFDDFTFETYFGTRLKGVPTASFGQQFNDPRSRTTDQYAAANAAFEHILSPTLNLHMSLNLAQYIYKGDYAYGPDAAGLNRDFTKSNTVTSEVRFLNTAIADHKITYGVEAFDGTTRLQRNFNVTPFLSVLDDNHPKRGYGLYAQDEFRLRDNLILNVGVRRDYDSESGSSTNPRLAIIYQATPDVTTKLIYGTAYRSPNAYENFYVTDATRFKRGPLLHPEHIKTFEFFAEYFPRHDFKTSASLFQYDLSNLVSLAVDPADNLLFFSNVNNVSARGLELEAEWLPSERSRLKASAAFQKAKDEDSGKRLTNAPAQVMKLNYSLPFLQDKARVGLEAQYTSQRDTVVQGTVGGFTVVNLTVSGIKLAPGLDLSGSIYNVLDKNYSDPPNSEHFNNSTPPRFLQGIHQDGRVFRLTLTYRL